MTFHFGLVNLNRNHINDKKSIHFGYVSKHSEMVGHILQKDGVYPGYKTNKSTINKPGSLEEKTLEKGVYIIECNSGINVIECNVL